MTNPNKTHITLLVDRTGSMERIRTDAEGAVNAFIADQRKEPGECTLMLVDFDAPGSETYGDSSQPWFHVIHNGDLQTAPTYHLEPRGNTALFDAMGRVITETGTMIAALDEDERPAKVFIVIQTDGLENASREWGLTQLVSTIKTQEDKYSWTFIFLGAGLDAARQAQQFVGTRMHANTVTMDSSAASYAGGTQYTSSNIASARAGKKDVKFGGDVDDKGKATEQ